ncbi:protein phosphatase 2C domain-containing protein [Antribacter sp. KLBMP9083]|uniref:Protein phosphatase 2C domain-containing protein n=1 Tax=Antribacter soli TaxID=2910976 RepID=A0AA41QGG9_9MICO|nr:protein phosphatase 2C domain-containing protein [Antribacter soli]MCF4121752.1 protein phosphatase 2C domain-containing protein [Antribacter soli]
MILAATLPGGTLNQDRHATGDGFALVLDGATSFAGDRSHDPGWYAEQLANALTVTVPDGGTLADAATAAIANVRDAHGLTPDTAPTSTIALARWSAETVETYVLGDSLAVVLHPDGTETVHHDDRLAAVAPAERAAYRAHLADGHGYDDALRPLLLALQAEQARHRNQPGGFWIAGAQPEAAQHGVTTTTPRRDVAAVMLATDGVALDRHPTATTWRDLYDEARHDGPAQVLQRIHDAEVSDPDGQRWPRAKPHDDKTLVVITPGD